MQYSSDSAVLQLCTTPSFPKDDTVDTSIFSIIIISSNMSLYCLPLIVVVFLLWPSHRSQDHLLIEQRR